VGASYARVLKASAELTNVAGGGASDLEQAIAGLLGGEMHKAVIDDENGLRFDLWLRSLCNRAIDRVKQNNDLGAFIW
jgi:hypothetical protein